MKAFSIDFLRN